MTFVTYVEGILNIIKIDWRELVYKIQFTYLEGSHNPNITPTTTEILEQNEFPLGFKNNNKSWRKGNTLTLLLI